MKEKEIRCICGNLIHYSDYEMGRKYEINCNKCFGRYWIKEELNYCPECHEELMQISESAEKYCERCKKTFS